jgi:hypothetical protein
MGILFFCMMTKRLLQEERNPTITLECGAIIGVVHMHQRKMCGFDYARARSG